MEYLAWDHARYIGMPDETEKAMRKAADFGIAGLIPSVRNPDFPLKTYCAAAKDKHIKVHAWVPPAFGVER